MCTRGLISILVPSVTLAWPGTPFRSSLELYVGDVREGPEQCGKAVEGHRELLGNGSFPRSELYAFKALSSREFKNFWWVLRGQHAGTGWSSANHLTVPEASLLAPWGLSLLPPRLAAQGPQCWISLHLPVIWGQWLGTSHLHLSLLILAPQPAGSSLLEGATDDTPVKTGAQGWQPRRVTGDQGRTSHCGFAIIPSSQMPAGDIQDSHTGVVPMSQAPRYIFLSVPFNSAGDTPATSCCKQPRFVGQRPAGPSPGRAVAAKLHGWG